MNNTNIRDYANKKNVHLWEIATKLNINDGNFSRRLRKELTSEEQKKIIRIIDELSKEKKGA